jgi:hypothetical protein
MKVCGLVILHNFLEVRGGVRRCISTAWIKRYNKISYGLDVPHSFKLFLFSLLYVQVEHDPRKLLMFG